MSDQVRYRLSPTTAVEPLVNKWVAWSHVMSPVPASLHLQHYQLNVLQSYLEDPKVHVEACQNPTLRSGPLVDIPEERAHEVAAFLDQTGTLQAENLQLAESLIGFHNQVVEEAKGQSLEPYYARVPRELRGYVELIYDYYNRPTVRCLESLLYKSPYYKRELQSLRIFRQTLDNARPFFMSTPRLPAEAEIEWRVPFDSPLVEEFFKLEFTPQPLGYIRQLLGLTPADDELLLPLLTKEEAPSRHWDGSSVRLRYFGHACVLIEYNGVSILTDPCLGVIPGDGGIERLTYQDLPEKIDYVLITHGHHDHFCMESLLRLRHRTGCLVVPRSSGIFYGDISLKTLAQELNFKNVVELDTLESIPFADGEIVAIPFMGEHADLPHSKCAYVVRAGTEQILFAADSDCLDSHMYAHVRRILGPIQTVFIGLECVGAPLTWSCGPFLPVRPEFSLEQSRRYKGCDAGRAQVLLDAVGADRLYIYAMGLEPWLEYLLGLALTEDSPQITEAQRLLGKAQERGYLEAKLLFGQDEIHLDSFSLAQSEFPSLVMSDGSADMEDEFRFD
jgi:L-ascorbate metabolism protein UlaG (beta-lactamase superfamily)